MNGHDVVILVVSSALALSGLLLVFLPFFANRLEKEPKWAESLAIRQFRSRLLWAVPILIIIAIVDASLGLLTLWNVHDLTVQANWLLFALIWLVAILALFAVIAERGVKWRKSTSSGTKRQPNK
jgi:amino acid transporter